MLVVLPLQNCLLRQVLARRKVARDGLQPNRSDLRRRDWSKVLVRPRTAQTIQPRLKRCLTLRSCIGWGRAACCRTKARRLKEICTSVPSASRLTDGSSLRALRTDRSEYVFLLLSIHTDSLTDSFVVDLGPIRSGTSPSGRSDTCSRGTRKRSTRSTFRRTADTSSLARATRAPASGTLRVERAHLT